MVYIRQEIRGYSPDIPRENQAFISTRQLVMNGVLDVLRNAGVLEPTDVINPDTIHFCGVQVNTRDKGKEPLKEMGMQIGEVIVILPSGESVKENAVKLFVGLGEKYPKLYEAVYENSLCFSLDRPRHRRIQIVLPMTANDEGELFINGYGLESSPNLKVAEKYIYLGNKDADVPNPGTILLIVVRPAGYNPTTGAFEEEQVYVTSALMPKKYREVIENGRLKSEEVQEDEVCVSLGEVANEALPAGRNGEVGDNIIFVSGQARPFKKIKKPLTRKAAREQAQQKRKGEAKRLERNDHWPSFHISPRETVVIPEPVTVDPDGENKTLMAFYRNKVSGEEYRAEKLTKKLSSKKRKSSRKNKGRHKNRSGHK